MKWLAPATVSQTALVSSKAGNGGEECDFVWRQVYTPWTPRGMQTPAWKSASICTASRNIGGVGHGRAPESQLPERTQKEKTLMKSFASLMTVTALLAGMSAVAFAQEHGSAAAIQKRLESEYALTKTTDDRSDIVTAGAVLVLQKDKLMMLAASSPNPCTNTYKDGKLSPNGACKAGDVARHIPFFGSKIPGSDKAPDSRYYVTGEKFWVTGIEVKDAGRDSAVVMQFFTDAVNDVRFATALAIPFRDGLPSPDEVLKRVQEVVTVAPSDDASQGGGQAAPEPAAPPPPAAEAAPPPIAPPPPPPPDAGPPPTVALGQTRDQVVGILGEPVRKAKVGVKEIYSYKDLKVIFVNGKVKDIQ